MYRPTTTTALPIPPKGGSSADREDRTMNIPKCSTCRRWKKEYWCIECNYEAKDLVEVVRCKDCKHNYNTCFNRGANDPICDFTDRTMKETDFCSFGERRTEK